MAISQDETLKGNEKIEEAILGLQKETSQEMLAHVLTVIRRRMNENAKKGNLIHLEVRIFVHPYMAYYT